MNYAATTITLGQMVPGGNTATASCPVGQRVIGGGALLSSDDFASVNDSGPTISRTGWEATGYSGGANASMTVTAICTVVNSIDGQERKERGADGPPPVYYYDYP